MHSDANFPFLLEELRNVVEVLVLRSRLLQPVFGLTEGLRYDQMGPDGSLIGHGLVEPDSCFPH